MTDLRGPMAPRRVRFGSTVRILAGVAAIAALAAVADYFLHLPPKPSSYSLVANNALPAPSPPATRSPRSGI
jgi:hypothetical protein